jgi:hypothetical protein
MPDRSITRIKQMSPAYFGPVYRIKMVDALSPMPALVALMQCPALGKRIGKGTEKGRGRVKGRENSNIKTKERTIGMVYVSEFCGIPLRFMYTEFRKPSNVACAESLKKIKHLQKLTRCGISLHKKSRNSAKFRGIRRIPYTIRNIRK